MTPNYIAGRRAAQLLQSLRRLPDNHYEVHRIVAEELRADGFEVEKFVDVSYWHGTRNGRIDVVAQRDGGVVAIELNNRSLKSISAPKLRAFRAYRVIAMRGVEMVNVPAGVDEAVKLDVVR